MACKHINNEDYCRKCNGCDVGFAIRLADDVENEEPLTEEEWKEFMDDELLEEAEEAIDKAIDAIKI